MNASIRCIVAAAALVAAASGGRAEGVLGDVLSGELVNPEVGAYAVYRIDDAASGQRFFMRQAIVGKEKTGGKTGWWVETELAPPAGFPVVYRMLVTGPASDTANVHEIVVKRGNGAIEHVKIEDNPATGPAPAEGREDLGREKVATMTGEIEAQHFRVRGPAGAQAPSDIWIAESIPPMGIVKMTTPEGDLVLQRHGKGGKGGAPAISEEELEKARGAHNRKRNSR